MDTLSDKSKKVYIAGPMRGKDNFNFQRFDWAYHHLSKLGCIPVSPADIDRVVEGYVDFPPDDLEMTREFKRRVILRDLVILESCDAIFMLNGWEQSNGACVERAFAKFLGLEIMYETT